MNFFASRYRAGARSSGRRPAMIARGACLVLALLSAASLPALSAAATTTHYDVTGDDVVIYNLIGTIRIESGSGAQVGVDVTADGHDADRLRVETGPKEDRPSLRVIYPGDRFVYGELGRHSSSNINVRDDGTFGNLFSGRRVRISSDGSGLDAHADLVVRVPENRTVTVRLGVGEVRASRVNAKLQVHTVSAPVYGEEMKGSLKIGVGAGAVQVHGIQGLLSIDTGSGSVEVTHADSRSLHVDTGSGSVSGSEISADLVDVDTGSGGIELVALDSPDIRLDTGSGSVEIDLLDDVDRLMIDTGSGGVHVGVPDNLGADLRIDTGSGGIDIGVPHQAISSRRTSFHGRLGDGNGRIVIDTGSGGVEVVGASRKQP